jgi:hypothetical protein
MKGLLRNASVAAFECCKGKLLISPVAQRFICNFHSNDPFKAWIGLFEMD